MIARIVFSWYLVAMMYDTTKEEGDLNVGAAAG